MKASLKSKLDLLGIDHDGKDITVVLCQVVDEALSLVESHERMKEAETDLSSRLSATTSLLRTRTRQNLNNSSFTTIDDTVCSQSQENDLCKDEIRISRSRDAKDYKELLQMHRLQTVNLRKCNDELNAERQKSSLLQEDIALLKKEKADLKNHFLSVDAERDYLDREVHDANFELLNLHEREKVS